MITKGTAVRREVLWSESMLKSRRRPANHRHGSTIPCAE